MTDTDDPGTKRGLVDAKTAGQLNKYKKIA